MQLSSKRVARYSAPAAVVAFIALGAAVPSLSGASAPSGLPATTAQAVLAEALAATPAELTGTLTWTADLGLSDISSLSSGAGAAPVGDGGSGGPGGFNPLSLLSGSYDINVWLDGASAEHLALLNAAAQEVDVVRNGDQAWVWDSAADTASHFEWAASPAGASSPSTSQAGLTPAQLASKLLTKSAASTSVALGAPLYVAGQPAYQLDVAPKASGSTVNHVEVDVAATGPLQGVVLQVAVYANGQVSPALDLGYTGTLTLGKPPAAELTFTPPRGATVSTHHLADSHQSHAEGPQGPRTRPQVIGKGWAAVVSGPSTGPGGAGLPGELGELGELARTVVVNGQPAQLLTTSLVNVLLTANGRYYAGLVTPKVLEGAASAAGTGA